MKYFMQETKHNPPETYGDCVRTCIACLLDREPLTVPNFFDPAGATENEMPGFDPWYDMEQWLSDNGYTAVKMHVGGSQAAFFTYMETLNPGVLYIVMGNGHAVVCCGAEVIHDPSWLKLGVEQPELIMFLLPVSMRYDPTCPICGGDCAGANPPVANCPNAK